MVVCVAICTVSLTALCPCLPLPVALQAVEDFMERIAKYCEIYEPITDRTMHYIKLTDM